ncbi:hypothetical protein FOTG_09934 [Fusarium oxysporum f. sp. vasinfectum 25433]|uniref:Uncharacterized protein n=1 Tax=Fusarium oxysporum f. sp. vasinfectum 25433 TaxID=1089449 RepID=X0MNX3_FUSOX|nr:hypothetical protein FOTG_09934 [Fusarium oxysporum f. sp. vasinfectum 25433]
MTNKDRLPSLMMIVPPPHDAHQSTPAPKITITGNCCGLVSSFTHSRRPRGRIDHWSRLDPSRATTLVQLTQGKVSLKCCWWSLNTPENTTREIVNGVHHHWNCILYLLVDGVG